MKIKLFLIGLFLLSINSLGQEVVLRSNFSIRDFKIKDSTIVYIEKRDIKSFNLSKKKADTLFTNNSFFIGGYGLNIFYPKDTNQIITASNELVRDISSIRFYDLQKKEVDKFEVYYTTELIDFLAVPKEKLFFLSKKDSTIEIFRYGKKPRYKKTNVITLDSYGRKIKYLNKNIYYITDNGNFGTYDYMNNTKNEISINDTTLTDFILLNSGNFAIISNIKGQLFKVEIDSKKVTERDISKTLIETIEYLDNNLFVVGDWGGNIFILNTNFELIHQHKLKKRIIKIVKGNANSFYVSSEDHTIRRYTY